MSQIPHILDNSGYGWYGAVAMILMLGFLFAIGKTRSFYVKKIKQASLSGQRVVNYTEEREAALVNILLTIVTILSLAFAVTALLRHYSVITLSPLNISIVLATTFLFVSLKYLLSLLLSTIYSFNLEILRIWLSLLYIFFSISLLVLTISLPYFSSPSQPLIALAVLSAIALLAEFFILVKNFSSKPIVVFYIFLYLCAAEILPLAVGFKAVSNVLN